MKRFTQLFCELDQTTRTSEKIAALERYFSQAPPADAAWALQFLSGRVLARLVSTRHLRQWAAHAAGLPDWLVDECSDAVGDLAETLALLLPDAGQGPALTLSQLIEQRLLPLGSLPDSARRALLVQTWRELNANQRMVWNKIITGNFRVGVARTLVVRALAAVAGIDPAVMAHRLLGNWQPTPEDFQRLLSSDATSSVAKPYPFFLASPLETKIQRGEALDKLGDIQEWIVEWKWDGIRAQLLRRGEETMIWSRGDDMVTDSFPEIAEAAAALPDGTVLDGEILAWRGEGPLPFGSLQRRLGRKTVGVKTRQEFPVAFVAYDILEHAGQDIRAQALVERRGQLELVVAQAGQAFRKTITAKAGKAGAQFLPGFEPHTRAEAGRQMIRLSPLLHAESWGALATLQSEARGRGVEGLMLKRAGSAYGVGRQRGDWWKWKIDPYVIDAVLIAAQPGHGRRASLFTDYTFALWDQGRLVPVAKAYSGLTDAEIRQVDSFVRKNTTEKFGPVRSVAPVLVFELAFEGVRRSTRHKSGVAVRFPRMNRWRQDKKPEEADTLANLLALAKT